MNIENDKLQTYLKYLEELKYSCISVFQYQIADYIDVQERIIKQWLIYKEMSNRKYEEFLIEKNPAFKSLEMKREELLPYEKHIKDWMKVLRIEMRQLYIRLLLAQFDLHYNHGRIEKLHELLTKLKTKGPLVI